MAIDVVNITTRAAEKSSKREYRSNNLLPLLWYDMTAVGKEDEEAKLVVDRIFYQYYSGCLINFSQANVFLSKKYFRHEIAIKIEKIEELNEIFNKLEKTPHEKLIIVSKNNEILQLAKSKNIMTCFYIFVNDKATLHQAIAFGQQHSFVLIKFKDPTNIPLELVIAELQHTKTVVIKEIDDHEHVDDVVNSMSTMEFGVEGVVFTPLKSSTVDRMFKRVEEVFMGQLTLETAEIFETRPVGDGIRGCIDLSLMFNEDEGILVGSTSQGGFLCCPEVFEMPYMNKREFRINAGGVHSYVFTNGNRTQYISELRSGDSAMVVDMKGQTKPIPIGRVKLEKRPLRIIRARFASGEEISILMQDDWHVRIFSDQGKPLHLTDLKPGVKVKAYKANSGRHVGVPVSEFIEEV
ncbi:3-dehydroquinate synthase [Xenorhabdus bovienii str. oregonense]|uniref:3-dehydroquinate synthase n=1 Tax=Xenorhabdus bovienii str. oregonense TaxID=1398202 RepID=A0A077P1D4_XENBV|nr:3-dehydroquinate synthase II [Xenorhabdus bovienii]CDH08202.1 3-dehydroquinate synthase [Xenorhabdus bovienii str. oregonense]